MPSVKTNGLMLHYDSFGEGPPLVLIMGLGAQMTYWREPFCRQLADSGFQVIRFDNRDVGLSTKLREKGVPSLNWLMFRWALGLTIKAPYTLEDMSDDVAGMLDALAVNDAHFVGASMGGMIAQLVAIRHPERIRSLTSIMSTTGQRRYLVARSPRALRAIMRPVKPTRSAVVENTVEVFRLLYGPGFDYDEAETRSLADRNFDRSHYPIGFARQFAAVLASGDRTSALRNVTTPTLVIHGISDPLVRPSAGKATARAIPGATLKLIKGMGHALPRGAWPIVIDAIARHAHEADVPSALNSHRQGALGG